jgi:hypothetical protein
MGDVLTMDEIRARYAPDWVLIAEPQTDENHSVLAGRVVFHSPDRDAIYDKAIELGLDRIAVRPWGHGPKMWLWYCESSKPSIRLRG